MSLISADVAYLASLQGRAWIAADSGEIQHMETNIDGIPELGLLRGYISIHYAPVVYYPAELRKVLPQTVDTYGEFKDHRTMEYHTFSDYHLFTSTATIKLKH
jgi:hypothetical protein